MNNILSKIITIVFLMIAFQSYATAQQRSFGQWSVKAAGGYHLGGSWAASIGAEKNIRLTKHSISGDIISFVKNYKIHTEKLKVMNNSLLLQYNYTALNWKFLLLSMGVGGFVGITLHDSTEYIVFDNPVSLSAGVAASLNIEVLLGQMLSICLTPVLLVDFAQDLKTLGLSSSNRFKFNAMGGLKIFF